MSAPRVTTPESTPTLERWIGHDETGRIVGDFSCHPRDVTANQVMRPHLTWRAIGHHEIPQTPFLTHMVIDGQVVETPPPSPFASLRTL